MRASERAPYPEVVAIVREALDSLSMTYLRNEGKGVTEFEVKSPCRFRVVVTERPGESFGFPFRSGTKDETALELHRDLEADSSDADIRQGASALVEEVIRRSPKKPWEGFGTFRSRSEKARWLALKEFPRPGAPEPSALGSPGAAGPGADTLRLESKDYLALAIAALETVLLPLVVFIVAVLVLLALLR